MFWPTDLAVFYPHPAWHDPNPEQTLLVPAVISGGVLLLVSAVATWRLRRTPGLAVGWFWFLGTLVPMIGLIQVGQQQLADRYAYIPLIGLAIMAVAFVFPVAWTSTVRLTAVLTLAIWFGESFWQLGFWQNSITLFTRAASVTRNNSWAHHNLALALQHQGNYSAAIEHYQQALAIDPNYVLAHYNLGIAWQDLNQLDEAIREFELALQLDDRNIDIWIRLGGAMGQAGHFERAEECFRKALSIDTTHWRMFSARSSPAERPSRWHASHQFAIRISS